MAIDTFVHEQIDEIISTWLNEGRMFTAFEVSLAVKNKGVEERHRDLRDYIHAAVFRLAGPGGNYTRTLMDVGAPQQAWVYHPVTSNPYEYQPLDRTGLDPVPVPRAPSQHRIRKTNRLTSSHSSPANIPSDAFGTDQRGRLTIPVWMLAKLGVQAGDRVAVVCDPANQQALITRGDNASPATPDTTYTAEPDGNVRITQGTLERAGLDGLQCYQIEGSDTVITIREYVNAN